MPKIKLTKTVVAELTPREKGQTIYWDNTLNGFGVCVGQTKKAYIAQRDINGRTVRYTIGCSTIFSADIARREANEVLLMMSKGQNPNELKRKERDDRKTLMDVHKEYMEEKEGMVSNSTLNNGRSIMKNHLKSLANRDLRDIAPVDIKRLFIQLTKEKSNNTANAVMKYVATLYNFENAEADIGCAIPNPVQILKKKKMWHKKKRRQTYIQDVHLHDWYQAVMDLPNHSIRDGLRMLLLTGARRNEIFKLKWGDVDLKARTFILRDTKNGDDLWLPMGDFLHEMLLYRAKNSGSSEYVFNGKGEEGHIVEAKKSVARIIEQSGVKFIIHDLRRTFITKADRAGISRSELKTLVNHKTNEHANDVTEGYIIRDPEQLREPMQRVEDAFLDLILNDHQKAAITNK